MRAGGALRTSSRTVLTLTLALALVARISPALADDPMSASAAPAATATAEQQALALFEQSVTSYENGRFQDAVDALREAYRLKPEPVILYNIARAREGLGDVAGAANSYGEYLAADPRAPDRGAIEKRISTLKAQLRERDELQRQRDNARARAGRPARSAGAVPWVVAGAGAAGLVAGAVFGALSVLRHDAALGDAQTSVDGDQSVARTFATASYASLLAGGVVLGIGVVWAIVDSRGSHTEERPATKAAGDLAIHF